jgi:hypothetical protein
VRATTLNGVELAYLTAADRAVVADARVRPCE